MSKIFRSFLFTFILILTLNCGAQISAVSGDSTDSTETTTGTTSSTSAPTLLLPYAQNQSYQVIQSYNGTFSHSTDCNQYAVDFQMDSGTNVLAVADGRVVSIKEDSNSRGATVAFANQANYIIIDHGGGYYSQYLHLCQNCVDVVAGATVSQGDVIGQSGNTGWSTEPHLHFEMDSWTTACSASLGFDDILTNQGIPQSGTSYTSDNDGTSTGTYTQSTIPTTAFAENGVTLNTALSWVMTKGQTITITGTVSNSDTHVAIFLIENSNWIDGATATVNEDKTFSISYTVDSSLTANSYTVAMDTSSDNSYYSEYSLYVYVPN